ncbi:MAG: hypothetical protein FD135_576 [Comamonadaceae bacterium]|nr:MAG: hypothetical protein FD135_576 [Comamonadaceae bacterium]
MKTKPLRTLQIALGLSGNAVDGRYGPSTRALGQTTFNPATPTDGHSWRGGSTTSTHGWGIAFDFDPDHNPLKWDQNRARLAQPEYAAWWQCWEAEGWVSLERSRNCDWMHVQAARV